MVNSQLVNIDLVKFNGQLLMSRHTTLNGRNHDNNYTYTHGTKVMSNSNFLM